MTNYDPISITPLGSKLLVQLLEESGITLTGGVYSPEDTSGDLILGKVVSKGDEVSLVDIEDVIYFGRNIGSHIKSDDGLQYRIFCEKNVIAVSQG